MKAKTKIMMERISLVSSARLVFFLHLLHPGYCAPLHDDSANIMMERISNVSPAIFRLVHPHHFAPLHDERVVAARELQQTSFEDGPSN